MPAVVFACRGFGGESKEDFRNSETGHEGCDWLPLESWLTGDVSPLLRLRSEQWPDVARTWGRPSEAPRGVQRQNHA